MGRVGRKVREGDHDQSTMIYTHKNIVTKLIVFFAN